LIPVDEARRVILAACPALPPRSLPLVDALGCVTAGTVVAGHDVPSFPNSAMDGFAVRAEDTADAPVTLDVVGTVAAGAAPGVSVGAGQAVRIMTGAVVPAGADAIVMVERTSPAGAGVRIEVPAEPGDHIRHPGEDLRAGQVLFEPGTELAPGHLGVLASVGATDVEVIPPARVGVLSTGDELASGDLRAGQIRDSNRPMLLALVAQAGWTPVDLGTAPDDEAAITAAIERGVADCDAVLTSGGVSVGDFDYVKVVLDRVGDMHWWQVAVKPAKPLAFGTVRGTPVFGLPGNPVSSLVSFELFARPALRQMTGHRGLFRPEIRAVADEALRRSPDGKLHLARVVATAGDDGRVHVRSSGGQGSHLLRAMALANALALLPDGDGVEAGDTVKVMLLT
jgi:molybdopterin molybdotransferase